jgi:hypothetical protein
MEAVGVLILFSLLLLSGQPLRVGGKVGIALSRSERGLNFGWLLQVEMDPDGSPTSGGTGPDGDRADRFAGWAA